MCLQDALKNAVALNGNMPKEETMAGLKLMLEKGDKILIGDDTIITVMALGRRPQVHIDAPQEVKLLHIKADPDKQFLNRKNKGS